MHIVGLTTVLMVLALVGQANETGQDVTNTTAPKPRATEASFRKSKPLRVNDVEFRAVVQASCTVPRDDKSQKFTVGLRIANLGKTPFQFELYDTYDLHLMLPDGERLHMFHERENSGDGEGGNVVVLPGKNETIPIHAAFWWSPESGIHLTV